MQFLICSELPTFIPNASVIGHKLLLINILLPSEKDSLEHIKARAYQVFQILFYPKNVCTVLPIDKFYNRPVFLPKSVTVLCVTFIDIYSYFFKNIVHFTFQILVVDRRRYTNNFSSVSAAVLSISQAVSFSLHYPLQTFWIYIFCECQICFQFLEISE